MTEVVMVLAVLNTTKLTHVRITRFRQCRNLVRLKMSDVHQRQTTIVGTDN